MMGYNNEIKAPAQNDFWFNETPIKPPPSSPPRHTKSLFSPSPEHNQDDKAKYMMMTNLKRESSGGAVNSPKEEKRSTPSKREKSAMVIKPPHISPIDKKFVKTEQNPPSTVDLSSLSALTQDTSMTNKKRPFSSVKDTMESSGGSARGEKVRKTDGIKLDSQSRMPQVYGSSELPTIPTSLQAKQPIETNPDVVKLMLKECFSTSSKFDAFDHDSPLDVINPEPPEELLAVPHIPAISTSLTNSICKLN